MAKARGSPKTGGRKKGTLNKSTTQIRELAQKHGPEAIIYLCKIMKSEETPEATRLSAAKELLDRGYGRPTEMHEHSGPDGDPIPASVEIHERVRNIVERLRNRGAKPN